MHLTTALPRFNPHAAPATHFGRALQAALAAASFRGAADLLDRDPSGSEATLRAVDALIQKGVGHKIVLRYGHNKTFRAIVGARPREAARA